MPQSILEKLKKLGSISPDPDYSRVSLLAILRLTPQKPPLGVFGTFTFRLGLVMTVFAIIIFGTIKSGTPLELAGLDTQSLQAEANELDLQLRLTEVSPAVIDQSMTSALKEAAQNGPGHLNTLVIKNEAPKLDVSGYANPEVDKALDALNQ
ncbi:MAG: hypothetical protein Q8P97_02075 [bacterium]|nr:hypothetical protein [bacterium]